MHFTFYITCLIKCLIIYIKNKFIIKNLRLLCETGGGSTPHPASNKPATTPQTGVHLDDDAGLFDMKPTKMETEHARTMDYDDSKIDDDLDKILQHIKEEQQNSMVLKNRLLASKSNVLKVY